LSLKVESKAFPFPNHVSLFQSFSRDSLIEFLSPIWQRQKKSDFAIRSHFSSAGTLVNGAYVGGIYDPINNQIVFIPRHQTLQAEWHVYDCVTGTVLAYPRPSGTFASGAYYGGVYDPTNNQIVFVPADQASQSQWHVYDCVTRSVLAYPRPAGTFSSGAAYTGGVYDPENNQIVFVPHTQATQTEWHVYDCDTQTVLSYLRTPGAFASGAYVGGVYDPENKQIVFVPRNQSLELEWHVYDCNTRTILSYPRPTTGVLANLAYSGGVYDPMNNQIVFVPRNQSLESEWHVYDCPTKTVLSYSKPSGIFAEAAYLGGVYDPLRNQIVFVPFSQASELEWHVYDCETKTVLSYARPVTGAFANMAAYAGGVYDPGNNQIVFIPFHQASELQWHTLQNFGVAQAPRQLAAHYLFNKF
jgi:hypothetical protein